ncbi:MAG: FimV/HubP family polar landmark protein, partial [Acidiferrobacterales bacterium]
MTKRKIKNFSAGLVIGLLAWLPSLTYAIGLGQLKVNSALDEPLNGEIPFTSLNSAERRKLDVRLASRSDFAAAGIDRSNSLRALKFTVAKRVDGRYFLQIRTDEPFREPFLHMLIHLQWAGGRLIREYTALIDPPYLATGKPASIDTPRTAVVSEPVETQVAQAQPEPVFIPDTKEPEPSPPVAPAVEPAVSPQDSQAAKAEIAAESAPEPLPLDVSNEPLPDLETGNKVILDLEPEITTGDALAVDKSEQFGPGGDSAEPRIAASGWPEDEIEPAQPIVEELRDEQQIKPFENELALEPELGLEPGLDSGSGQADTIASGSLLGPAGSDDEIISGDYKVVRGDTLWQIAKQARPDESVSIEQVAMAIFRNNQRAFFDDNVNNLKAGKILAIPEPGQVSTTGPAAARKEFLAQYSVWQEYKLRIAGAQNTLQMDEEVGISMEAGGPGEPAASGSEGAQAILGAGQPDELTPITTEEETASIITNDSKQASGDKAGTTVAGKTGSEATIAGQETSDITPKPSEGMPAEDLLKIVRSKQDKETTQQDKAVPDSESRDQRSASEKAALADKVATLEESLSSADLANAEAEKRAGSVSEQLDTQKRLIELENQNLAQGQPGEQVQPDANAGAGSTDASQGQAKPVTPTVPSPPQKGFLEEIIEMVSGSSLLPIVGGVIAVFALVAGLMIVRRRRSANIEFEESILNSQIDSEGTLSMDSGEQSEGGDTSFLSDFSQGGMGNVSTDEVDPVAEAEVYLAYGRDEQAEEILKDAIIKEPARHELREKLLEVYSKRNDISAFETVAEELYAALEGRGGDLWDRVAAMGAKLNPVNPMFGGEGAGMANTSDTVPPGGLDTGETTHVGLDDSGAFDSPTEMASGDVFSETSADKTIKADAMDFSMDGSLDIGVDDTAPATDSSVTEDAGDMDFSLSMGEDAATTPADESSSLDFNMGGATE